MESKKKSNMHTFIILYQNACINNQYCDLLVAECLRSEFTSQFVTRFTLYIAVSVRCRLTSRLCVLHRFVLFILS